MPLQPDGMEGTSAARVSIVNTDLDDLLTQSLQENGLPGVGVHVWADGTGDGTIILYGFVATLNQRNEAEAQARETFSDFRLPISDRIKVSPELLTVSTLR